MPQKKFFTQPPLYKNIDLSIESKVLLPTLNDLYNKMHHSYFPEFTPHSDPKVRILDRQVFPNIKCSLLHMVASRTLVLPCIEALEWIISHTDVNKCLINDFQEQCVGVFLPVEVNK
jgi:hypothetical protein